MSISAAEKAELALTQEQLECVRRILRDVVPGHRAWAFGSRVINAPEARTQLKPHSDLDLALEGPALKPQQWYALREAFSESDLPMRVDVVDAADLPVGWNIRAWPL